MPSRRAFLAVAAVPFAGCASGPALTVPNIENQSCPPFDVPETRARCSHTDTSDGIDVSAEPTTFTTERESLEALALKIENTTDEPLELRPHRWRLYRNTGFGWDERAVDSFDGDDDVDEIEPGGSFGWSGIDAILELGASGRTPAGLYAAVMSVGASGETVACVFLFRVTRQ